MSHHPQQTAPALTGRATVRGERTYRKVKNMAIVPVIWTAWIASLLLLIGVSIYAARVTKDEDDQLFLSEASTRIRSEQASIAAQAGKVQPIRKGALVVVAVTSLCVLGYYVFDIIRQFSH